MEGSKKEMTEVRKERKQRKEAKKEGKDRKLKEGSKEKNTGWLNGWLKNRA